ncbi:MAG: Na(+) H(+) antiporter subunit F, partial [uncultured Thermomicrobiales bacterium]
APGDLRGGCGLDDRAPERHGGRGDPGALDDGPDPRARHADVDPDRAADPVCRRQRGVLLPRRGSGAGAALVRQHPGRRPLPQRGEDLLV